MKTTISLDNAVLEQLLTYTQAKTTKESIANAIEIYIRFISKTADDVGFNLSNIKQIRVNDSNNLREQLKQQIAIYYRLVSSGD